MAPVFVAGRLLSVLFVMFLLFLLSPVSFYCHPLIVYDRQQLINIYQSMPKPYETYETHSELKSFCFYSPPDSSNLPRYLRWQIFNVSGRRCEDKIGFGCRLPSSFWVSMLCAGRGMEFMDGTATVGFYCVCSA